MVAADAVILPLLAVVSVWLISPPGRVDWPEWALPAIAVAGVLALHLAGFYRSIVRFMGVELIFAASRAVAVTALPVALPLYMLSGWQVAAKDAIAFWLLGVVYVAGGRFLVRLLLRSNGIRGDRVVVYGAGDAGAQLAASVAGRGDFTVIAFVDDNPALHGAVINGIEVHSPAALQSLIKEFGVSRVLLALPSATRRRRQEIISHLETLPVHVQTMPDRKSVV